MSDCRVNVNPKQMNPWHIHYVFYLSTKEIKPYLIKTHYPKTLRARFWRMILGD